MGRCARKASEAELSGQSSYGHLTSWQTPLSTRQAQLFGVFYAPMGFIQLAVIPIMLFNIMIIMRSIDSTAIGASSVTFRA